MPLNKNYLRNDLEPKNYLEVLEWQDNTSSGNCCHVSRGSKGKIGWLFLLTRNRL